MKLGWNGQEWSGNEAGNGLGMTSGLIQFIFLPAGFGVQLSSFNGLCHCLDSHSQLTTLLGQGAHLDKFFGAVRITTCITHLAQCERTTWERR